MFKQWIFISALALFSMQAQAQASEGTVKIGKTEEPAIVIVYNHPCRIVQNAFDAKFADKELSAADNKEFQFFPNAVILEISKSKLDYFFKIEAEGKEKTKVCLVMHGAGQIEGINELATRSKTFLEKMQSNVEKSSTIVEIKRQESLLVDEEQLLSDLKKSEKELEEKLQENKSKQNAQLKIIASQKAILEDLKAKIN